MISPIPPPFRARQPRDFPGKTGSSGLLALACALRCRECPVENDAGISRSLEAIMKTLSIVSCVARLAMLSLSLVGAACTASSADEDGAEDVATEADGISGQKKLDHVYITWYGFNDNSCQVESQHTCSNIAFPKSDGWKVPHNAAKEGKGTYDDPITFATGAKDDGSGAVLPVGTRIYVPSVRKYFVMEDQCAECATDWKKRHIYHVDLWMGPQHESSDSALTHCEEKLTIGSASHPTGVIIVNPKKDLPVDTGPLFTNGKCLANTYSNQ
jgi:hypothetical protein